MGKRGARRRKEIQANVREIDGIVDSAVEAPISQEEAARVKAMIRRLADLVEPEFRTTEKTADLVAEADQHTERAGTAKKGHGRNGASAYPGAKREMLPNPDLSSGCNCPECQTGKVYLLKDQNPLIRVRGGPPLEACAYERELYRCNLCGQIFQPPIPPEIGTEKYDETVPSALAQLKYGSGMPFYRLEHLQALFGVPMPAATQWMLLEAAAALLRPAFEELIRQAAQAELLQSDDTSMRVLKLKRPEGNKRTGVFTSGVLAVNAGHHIALYLTGPQHAGENLADILQHRVAGLAPPILMSDALLRNLPKGVEEGLEILWANCLAHGRRHFVDSLDSFPDEVRYVLSMLGLVYGNDNKARELGLEGKERLRFHQEHSQPLMKELRQWMTQQLTEKVTEESSGLGKAMKYMLRHWDRLTLFLRVPGAPLDNNHCERALKTVVLHRKNALFFLTMNGAQVGDLFMSLHQTCELNGVNPFDYLTELQRHAQELKASPADWMPWNYRDTLSRGDPG